MPRLRRTSPDQPGWTRRRSGRGFTYLDGSGTRLTPEDVERCRALVIPPAWQDVWISPHPNGHLQAVGTDDAGRRQYLYHPGWVAQRALEKHERVTTLGRRLPRVRERLLADLTEGPAGLERACALAVRMVDLGCFRVGSDVYAAENGSFGLTTLERRHVRRSGEALVFQFVGKSGVEHRIEVDEPLVVEVLDTMRRRRSPGDPSLFAYRAGRRWRPLAAGDVNEYLREVSRMTTSAKDFRTWHGTVAAAASLADAPGPEASATQRKRAVAAAMRDVSALLGNTPALARSAYVDPRVVDAYDEGRTIAVALRRAPDDDPHERRVIAERATLRLLKD